MNNINFKIIPISFKFVKNKSLLISILGFENNFNSKGIGFSFSYQELPNEKYKSLKIFLYGFIKEIKFGIEKKNHYICNKCNSVLNYNFYCEKCNKELLEDEVTFISY